MIFLVIGEAKDAVELHRRDSYLSLSVACRSRMYQCEALDEAWAEDTN